MMKMKNQAILILAASISIVGCNKNSPEYTDVACSYAPSQSQLISGLSATSGGAAASTVGLAKALGLSVVTHSSGSLILSGSSGYLAGTLGVAIVAPVVVTVGTVIGGAAVSLEIICSPKNHPEGYDAMLNSASNFKSSLGLNFKKLQEAVGYKEVEVLQITLNP